MRSRATAGVAVAALAIGIPVAAVSAHTGHRHHTRHRRHHQQPVHRSAQAEHTIRHVMLISGDGLHQSGLASYVANHPGSTRAKLPRGGAEYAHAQTPVPSDSDPGMTAQMTGGDPGTTGVFYD